MYTKEEKAEVLKAYKRLELGIKKRIEDADLKRIRRAFDIAMEAHKDMNRRSGEKYIHHPIEVARIVNEEIGLGETSIICALLHDTVEDTEISFKRY